MQEGYGGVFDKKLYVVIVFSLLLLLGRFFGKYGLQHRNNTLSTYDTSVYEQATVALIGSQSDDVSYTVYSRASGVIISPDGLILTAKHAIKSGVIYDVMTYDQHYYTVSQIWSDPHRDLAVLQIRDSSGLKPRKINFVPLISFDKPMSGTIITFGYHDGHKQLSSLTGMVVGYNDGVYETTSRLSPGMSGGPVFTIDGRLFGINRSVSRVKNDQSFVLAVDKEMIQGFLDKNMIL